MSLCPQAEGMRLEPPAVRSGARPAWTRSPEAEAASPRVIERLEDLDPLAEAWDRLESGLASPMQHYIWTRAAVESFNTEDDLRVVTVGPRHRPAAVAPLVRRRRALPRWELASVTELYEPLDFLYADPPSLAALADALVELAAPLWLKRVPANSPVVAALREAYRGKGWVIIAPDVACPWIALDATWLQPRDQLNAGRRSDLRRAERNAAKAGAVTYEILAPSLEQLGPLLDEAYRIEAANWKGAVGSALACDPPCGAFFRRYAAAACQKGILRLCFLRIGGQAAAMQLAIEWGEAFWLLRIGYDQKFARCSPGMLLLLHTIQYAARRHLRSYELLGAAAAWTQLLTHFTRPCVWIRAYPFGARGLATLASDTAWVMWLRSKKLLRGRS